MKKNWLQRLTRSDSNSDAIVFVVAAFLTLGVIVGDLVYMFAGVIVGR